MDLIKTHWKKAAIAIIIIAALSLVIWYIWGNYNIGVNKDYLLRKSVYRYSELIQVGLVEEVFNEYLTPEAKSKTTPGREQIPMTEEEKTSEQQRINACANSNSIKEFICEQGAKHKPRYKEIQIPASEIFELYAKERKDNWTNIEIAKIIYPYHNRADVVLKVDDKKHSDTAPIETWYLVGGKWLRDF